MNYTSKHHKKLLKRLKDEEDEKSTEGKRLASLSGQKGVEKKVKDRIGKTLNIGTKHKIYDKVMKNIDNIGKKD